MVNAYASFSLNDETLINKVLGDFTIDFCETLSGVAVAQTGMTLTQLGVGDYSLMNPNIEQETICALHLTADANKLAVVRFSPFAPGTTTYSPIDVREIFSFSDVTLTGKELGTHIAVDYFKTIAGASRSQTGLVLTELGAGVYSLLNPDTITLTLCRLHLIADSTKRAVLAFTPLDGVPSTSTPLREQILTALSARLATITIANGYRTSVGANVFTWKAGPFLPSEIPGMDIRDSDTFLDDTVGEQEHTLDINIRAISSGDTSPETVRLIQADIIDAVGTDLTWGGLADDTGPITAEQIDVETADAVKTGCGVKFSISYNTARFSA